MLALETLPASLRDMADRLGLPAVSYLVEKLGGTTIPVPLRASAIGEARYRRLCEIIGKDIARALCREYGGVALYIPNCRAAVMDARDAEIIAVRDALAKQGITEREIVERLARQYRLSDRQVWRILKRIPCQTASAPLFGRGVEQARLW